LLPDETDLFAEVKRNQLKYNEILQDFLMDQQKQNTKAFLEDEEFSDEVSELTQWE